MLPLWWEHSFQGWDASEIGLKDDSKRQRREKSQKIGSGAAPSRTFSPPGPFLVDFWRKTHKRNWSRQLSDTLEHVPGTSVESKKTPRRHFFAILGPKTGPRRLLFRCFFENGDFVKIVLPLWREHNFEGSDPPKFGSGSDSEQRRQQTTIKIASGAASGRTFSAPGRFLVHFGSILGSPGKKSFHAFWSFF